MKIIPTYLIIALFEVKTNYFLKTLNYHLQIELTKSTLEEKRILKL